MTAVVLSHLQIDQEALTLGNVIIEVPGAELVMPEYISDWDYSTPLKVRAEVVADLEACLHSSGAGFDAGLGLSMTWHASGSGLRGASAVHPLRDGRNLVDVDLDGALLGGILGLRVDVTLVTPSPQRERLAARRPGSRLWAAERRIRLEGSGSRFPVTHVSFADAGLAMGLGAAWLVLFESLELYDSGIGNLRLYLNTDLARVREFVDSPEEHPVLNEVLRSDVNRQIVLQGLASEELDLGHVYPNDTMGELLAAAVKRNFPGMTLDEVRALARNSPGEFEAHMQARGAFLG